jgi:nicotinamidase-related amidase
MKGKKRGSKRYGGAKEYSMMNNKAAGDSALLLNHYLYKRILNGPDNTTYKNVIDRMDYNTIDFNANDLLMVIDMQNDFVDRPVKATDGTDLLTGPLVPGFGSIGAFAVNNGSGIIDPIVSLYGKVLSKGGKVVFSRDVHPCDHCSFFKHSCETTKQEPNTPTGRFPPHCLSGSVGSGFVQEIYDDLKNKEISSTISEDGIISVIFKGCYQNTDSFGAAKYGDVEYGKKRQEPGCKEYSLENTGGFYANAQYYGNKEVLNDNFDAETNIQAEKIEFEVPDSIKRIFVVGLAGDYCVCDTAINLKKKYSTKEIIIIHELTRNAFIPFSSTNDSVLNNVKSDILNKNLYDYAFKFDGTSKSLTEDDRNDLTVDTLFNGTYFHFLTDINELFDRYFEAGVKVMIAPATIDAASEAINPHQTAEVDS